MGIVKKLRTKFILVATISVFVLLVAILGSVNISNFAQVASNADDITQRIASDGGKLSDEIFQNTLTENQGTGNQPGGGGNPGGPGSAETLASIRYFTYKFNSTDTTQSELVTNNMVMVEESGAYEWGYSLLGSKETGWSNTYYRYRLYTIADANSIDWTYVTVIDESRELSPSYQVLWASLIGSGIGLVVAFVAIFFISKWVFKPLEESQRKQKRFISNASHELKTPLAIISANAEILEIIHGQDESVEVIEKQVKRMTETVKNLNALAKIDELETPDFGSFILSDAAKEIAESFVEPFITQNKELVIDVQEDVHFKGNEAMMRQLIQAILSNALKYSDTKAYFTLTSNNGRVCIEEKNDSAYIKDGPLDSVFERFYRSDEARASSIEGSGIGLSIVKEVVDIHKGRISARGENGNFIIKADF